MQDNKYIGAKASAKVLYLLSASASKTAWLQHQKLQSGRTNTAKMTTNNNRQKKQHYFRIKQNNHDSKRHGERKETTATTNLLRILSVRNFCEATTQGIHLCIAATTHNHCTVSTFSLEEKQKNTPRGVLSANQILTVFFKKKSGFRDWSKLMSRFSTWTSLVNGDIDTQ